MMLTCLVAVAMLGLCDVETGKLSVVNDRLTHGHLGPKRDSEKFLPGDVIFLAFEVENMTFGTDGKASYGIGLEIRDPKGVELMKQKPRDAFARNYLGGTTLPSMATMQIPLETAPGTYLFRVTVIDNTSKSSVNVERKIDVLPKGFGLVHVGASSDAEAHIPRSPVAMVGESIYLNFAAVGFSRDPKSKQPNIKAIMRVLDEKGQPTSAAPMTGEAKSGVPDTMMVVPMQFGVTMNRAGRFNLELSATDATTGQTSKVTFPVRVIEP